MKKRKQQAGVKTVPNRSEPTPSELAALALAISNQTPQRQRDETPIKEALAIWLTARDVLKDWRENPAIVFPPEPETASPEPAPKRYPVKLGEFLRLMVPQLIGRSGEQGGLFREYLVYRLRHPSPPAQIWPGGSQPKNSIPFDCCKPQIVPGIDDPFSYSLQNPKPAPRTEPTKEEVDKYFTLWREKGIPDPQSYVYHVRWFRDWHQSKRATETSAAKAQNAYKRHAKAKLREHLWEKSRKAENRTHLPSKNFPRVTDQQMKQLLKLNQGKPLEDYKAWNYNIF